jgi:hypothetical protein
MSEPSKVKITPTSAAAHDGILFVSVTPTGKSPTTAGDPTHEPITNATIDLTGKVPDKQLKLVMSKLCVEVHREPGCTVAIAFVPGHPVVKSIQRMMRKLVIASANLVERKPEVELPKAVAAEPDHATTA